jgi:hypothetical protein
LGATATLKFIQAPTAAGWYRTHNVTIVAAYLANEILALRENWVERFFINLVPIRVLYAHALVVQPRLGLDCASRAAPPMRSPSRCWRLMPHRNPTTAW